ncbi:MAG: LPP20 family lipoprotein [Treponema sp.]|nr:LPP20 family lipoprotein [Treponema sp.]
MKTKPLGALIIAALISCAGVQPREQQTAAGPEWVYAPDSAYPENRYISAVGYGTDRESAEKNALGSLVAIFGQSVAGETMASYRYTEAVNGGLIDMREGSEIDSAVKTSFTMDTLIGAEIKDRWFDEKVTHYAIAVMDKMKSAMLYSDLIESNQRVIQNLTAIPEADRYSFDAYAQYELAADIADANTVFVNVLSVLSPASASAFRNELRQGDDYRLEARRVSQNIPVAVNVANDKNGRIRSAFAAVLSGEGFRTGGGDARYVLDVDLSMGEAELPQNPNKFVRYIIDANLRDMVSGAVLIPYSIEGREGHTSLSEAEVRAYRVAEEKIRTSYGEALRGYLSRLSSK